MKPEMYAIIGSMAFACAAGFAWGPIPFCVIVGGAALSMAFLKLTGKG